MPRLRQEDTGGITENRIDDAGRITLTADQRQSFPDGEVHLMLWLVDGCLRLCTEERRRELEELVEREWLKRPLLDLARRQTVGTTRIVTIDEAGRIRIPYMYLDFIGLDGHGKKAWLIPLQEGIYELWNPDHFKRQMEQKLYDLVSVAATRPGGSCASPTSDGESGDE